MGRPRDSHYRNQVTPEEDGGWTCKRCGRKYKGGVSRMKAHLDQIERQGIAICPVDRDNERVHNIIPSGSNIVQETTHVMNSLEDANMWDSFNPQNNTDGVAGDAHEMIDANIWDPINHQNYAESTTLLRGSAPLHDLTGSNNNNSALERDVGDLNQLLRELTCEEGYIKRQLECMESRGKKRKRQVDHWLNKVQPLKNQVDHINNSVHQFGLSNLDGVEIQELTRQVRAHKEEKPLVLSNEFVGAEFEKNAKKVWELLEDDQVFIIGIHGMGGVGKTTLVTQIENEIKRKGVFQHVFWVTVSPKCSIFKLQNEIAKRIREKVEGDDERTRAANLESALEKKGKSVLILDDVWKYIDVEKVGIPLGMNGIKLIVTSRLEHVCLQMNCLSKDIIRMHPLSFEEGLELFLLKLGHHGTHATLSPNVSQIAKDVADECYGLPLGIKVMARTMKGMNDIHQWRYALKKLKSLAMGEEMKTEVFKILKLSYDNLMDKHMQNCFLHLALYDNQSRDKIIMKLVDNGLINRKQSLKEIFDEGRIIMDKLKGHSLVSSWYWMHRLVRDMACVTMKETNRYMIKHNEKYIHEWTDDLEVVSLMKNSINEIPADTSPNCPRLSTLIFNYNHDITGFPKEFFTGMNGLTVLDLSRNIRLKSLPDSLSNLKSLISLVLAGCSNLKEMPPLGQLQALSRLDISFTSIELVHELEMLINLKWLDLSGNKKLKLIPGSVLPGLTNLQYLDIRRTPSSEQLKEEDIHAMSTLECLGVFFHDCHNYHNYVRDIQGNRCAPKYYHIHLGTVGELVYDLFCGRLITPDEDKGRIVSFGDCKQFSGLLPTDLARLYICENHQWTCLCGALLSHGSSSLRKIQISECQELKSLFCSSGSGSICPKFQALASLHRFHPVGVFSGLTHFCIMDCNKIEKLFTPWLLPQLGNLETIAVVRCDSLKEIFAGSNSDNDDGFSIQLPKLTILELRGLPELKTVCKGNIFCESMPTLHINYCGNLERSPNDSDPDPSEDYYDPDFSDPYLCDLVRNRIIVKAT